MDSKELLNLIRFVAKAGVSEVKYKTKDFEINIKTPLAGSDAVSYVPQPVAYAAPTAAPAPVATTAAAPVADADAKAEAPAAEAGVSEAAANAGEEASKE